MSSQILKIYALLCASIIFLISLGAATRAMNAGLACPDWPLCFGDIIPDYHPQVYFEFIHRALAGFISIVTAVLSVMLFRNKKISKSIKLVSFAAILILVIQIVLGGLTVLWQLHDKVVTAHLALGTAFFSLILWVYWSLGFYYKSDNLNFKILKNNNSRKALIPGIILLIFVYAQLLLGGQVASNYAALACPEFPLCFGEFIPTLSGSIGLNVMHRLGAYILVFVVSGVYLYVNKVVDNFMIRKIAAFSVAALMFQILLGILNIEFFIPPLITVLHSATATILLGLAVSMIRFSTFKQCANTQDGFEASVSVKN